MSGSTFAVDFDGTKLINWRNSLSKGRPTMRVTSFELEDQDLRDRIDAFMARFKIGTLLNRAGIRKLRGVSPLLVLRIIFELAFVGRNIFTGIHKNPTAPMGKDAVYRFLSAHRYNWRRLIGFLSQIVIKGFLEPLTDTGREKVLILDTTIYDRSRSCKVELLSPKCTIIAPRDISTGSECSL